MTYPRPRPPAPGNPSQWTATQPLDDAAIALKNLAGALNRLRTARLAGDEPFASIYQSEIGLYSTRSADALERVLQSDLVTQLRQLGEDASNPGEVDHSLRESGSASSVPTPRTLAESATERALDTFRGGVTL
jgi:hypothetical protein